MRYPQWRTLKSVLWFVIGGLLLVLLQGAKLSYTDRLAPMIVHARMDQPCTAHDFRVTVHGFRLAESYRLPPDATPHELHTPGVFLQVSATLEALRAPGPVSARLVSRNGNIYTTMGDARPKLEDVNLTSHSLAPGLPQRGLFFFALPPDQVPGVHIQFFWSAFGAPHSMGQVVDVDLGTGNMTTTAVRQHTSRQIVLPP